MSCLIFKLNIENRERSYVHSLSRHTEMGTWLKNNGEIQYIYEIWKGLHIHSRWCWKVKNKKWGRMATPKKKNV